jgi:alpha-ketoglutarate-dependent taurine dioxygenase
VDGSFQPAPFAYSIYHIVDVPRQGDTRFVPLAELVAALPAAQRARWERLWMCSDRRAAGAKPLIYTHPRSGRDTLCFHLGMTAAFVVDAGTPAARATAPHKTAALLREIEEAITQRCAHLIYSHRWQPGDFIISDNAALGHEAAEETQLGRAAVGLRIMHRTTVQGTTPPRKEYRLDDQGRRVPGSGGNGPA